MREYQQAINPKTGRLEVVFADLRLVYPDFDDPMAVEYSFEELRAGQRGWLSRDWASAKKAQNENANKQKESQTKVLVPHENVTPSHIESLEKPNKPQTVPLKGLDDEADENDENTPPSQAEVEKARLARKARREERANRTRKIKVMEVKEIRSETQTSMSSLLHNIRITDEIQSKPISIHQQAPRSERRRTERSPR
jgi:checkpoint serine/threonine-protein kinase